MEYYNNILCVSYGELTGGDNAVMPVSTLEKSLARGRVQRARRGGGEGSGALIVWASLPEKYRVRFVERIGDPAEVLKKEQMKKEVVEDSAARDWYAGFTYDLNGVQTHLTDKLIDEYTHNASVLRLLIRQMGDREALSKALNNRRGDLWEVLLATSERLRGSYGHTLPQSVARLRRKMKELRERGYASLVSGKVGNATAQKITEEAGRLLVALRRSRVPVYTDAQLFAEFNRRAQERGWKPLRSLRAMQMWLMRPEVQPLWYDAVHGERAAHQLFDRKHRTCLPMLRDSLWYGDGTRLNLYYRDEEGKVRTVDVYEVVDAYSEMLLGYCIGEGENYVAQYHAYRMAVQTSGHKPYEIVYDNQGGHKKNAAQGFFNKICQRHRPTAPYNGQSKTIENLFYRYQHEVLSRHWNFTGQNITARKATSRPNLEFIAANVRALPTLAELREQYAALREEWNALPHPATGRPRIEMYRESVNPATPEVSVYDMIDMFWLTTARPVTFTASGIEITIGRRKHAYEVMSAPGVPDLGWRRRNTLRKFYIQYDPYDLTSVRLLRAEPDGSRRFERVAELPIVIHRAQQEQDATERQFIRQQQEAVAAERVERQVAARQIEHDYGCAPEQHDLAAPRLKGLPAERQREIERRVRHYTRPAADFELGRITKDISNRTWDAAEPITLQLRPTGTDTRDILQSVLDKF